MTTSLLVKNLGFLKQGNYWVHPEFGLAVIEKK